MMVHKNQNTIVSTFFLNKYLLLGLPSFQFFSSYIYMCVWVGARFYAYRNRKMVQLHKKNNFKFGKKKFKCERLPVNQISYFSFPPFTNKKKSVFITDP